MLYPPPPPREHPPLKLKIGIPSERVNMRQVKSSAVTENFPTRHYPQAQDAHRGRCSSLWSLWEQQNSISSREIFGLRHSFQYEHIKGKGNP
jgi:hypothetical protein